MNTTNTKATASITDMFQTRVELLVAEVSKLAIDEHEKGKVLRIEHAQIANILGIKRKHPAMFAIFEEICLENGLLVLDTEDFYAFVPQPKMADMTSIDNLMCLHIKATLDAAME